jgi:DNA-binding MarR family transcriptional regulator
MTQDIVRSLGHLALGTRLKRIGDRLQSQAQEILEEEGIAYSVAFFPLMVTLDRLGPLPVGDLAQALGVSQPGVTRMVAKLKDDALVTAGPAGPDARFRPIMLTAAGKALVKRSQAAAWKRIERAVAEACARLSGPLLSQLTGLEEALAAKPLRQRVARKEGKYASS